MADLPPLDTDALRSIIGAGGPWARQCGERLRRRREELRFARSLVSRTVDCTEMTLARVERGEQIPRDHLRTALAMTLFVEVDEIWAPLSRQAVADLLEAS